MGFFAANLKSSFKMISGNSYCRQRYSFSSVFNFMCGQSLQAQLLSGGAGINVLPGFDFCIWCTIPVSVATINSCAVSVRVKDSHRIRVGIIHEYLRRIRSADDAGVVGDRTHGAEVTACPHVAREHFQPPALVIAVRHTRQQLGLDGFH